jgi:hypothetical protein
MDEILKQMKTNKGDKLVEKNCSTCEFNFGDVCAGHGTIIDNGDDTYGININAVNKMFPNGCNDYGISLNSFIEQENFKGEKK